MPIRSWSEPTSLRRSEFRCFRWPRSIRARPARLHDVDDAAIDHGATDHQAAAHDNDGEVDHDHKEGRDDHGQDGFGDFGCVPT